MAEFVLRTGDDNPFNDFNSGKATITKPVFVDINGDNNFDLVVGNDFGGLSYYVNDGSGAYTEATGADNPFADLDAETWTAPTFADINGDNVLDLVVGNLDGSLYYFVNDGSGAYTRVTGADNPFAGLLVDNRSTPAFADIDGDNVLDLVVGDTSGELSFFVRDEDGAYIEATTNPFADIDVRAFSTPTFVDLDDDNDFDLVVGSEHEGVLYYENNEGVYTQITGADNPLNNIEQFTGLLAAAFGDVDNDGDLDLVLGQSDGDLVYYENTAKDRDTVSYESSSVGVTVTLGANVPIDAEFQINNHTNSDQSLPSVTSLSDGGFVVTWQSLEQDGSGFGIYGQHYGPDGEAIGAEFQINSHTDNRQSRPSVTSLSDGGFVVTWASGFQDGSGAGIYGQRYGSDGTVIGTEFQVNSYTDGDELFPSVTALSDGGFVVTWQSGPEILTPQNAQSQDGSEAGIYGQRYGADGVAIGAEFQVNSYTDDDQSLPSVTALSDGGFVVTWTSAFQDEFQDEFFDTFFSHGVYGQRYDSDGAAVGAEFRINSQTNFNQQYPSVTSLSDGGFVVTWQSDRQDGSGSGIYGQRYGSDGEAIGAEFQINSYTDDDQRNPSVTSLSDGGFVVTWQSEGQDGSYAGIYGQRYGSDGVAIGEEFQISSHTDGDQSDPSVTSLSEGRFVVTWHSGPDLIAPQNTQSQDGSGDGIYGQIFSFEIQNIIGSAHDDVLTGDNRANRLEGGQGNDVLTGGAGVDTFVFNQGDSGIDAGNRDVITDFTIGQDRIDLSGFIVQTDFAERVTIAGQLVQVDSNGDGSTDFEIDLSSDLGLTESDFILGQPIDSVINVIAGTGQDDVLPGTIGNDQIEGYRGDDELNGDAGNDVLYGHLGDDVLNGGIGADVLTGGAGADTFVFNAGDSGMGDGNRDMITDFRIGQDKIDLSSFIDQTDFAERVTIVGQLVQVDSNDDDNMDFEIDLGLGFSATLTRSDFILGVNPDLNFITGATSGDDTIDGTADNDQIEGFSGDDTLNGDAGNDILYGHLGNDVLDGGIGADVLNGHRGDDMLTGGVGADVLTGGAGADIFVFNAGDSGMGEGNHDTITDFSRSAQDKIDLSSFIFETDFAERVTITTQFVQVDSDGDDNIDFVIDLGSEFSATLNRGDFILGVNPNLNFISEATAGDDTIDGTPDNDQIVGFRGDDTLNGNAGNDILFGHAGNDVLDGGTGDDMLTGGGGADTFVFNVGDGDDVVLDFAGIDTVQLSGRTQTAQEIVDAYGSVNTDGDVILDFGNGDSITFEGITDLSILVDDISIM